MDLYDYSYYESDSFIDSAPPDFRVQRTPCRTLNSIVVHSTMNVRQSIHFGLSIRHIQIFVVHGTLVHTEIYCYISVVSVHYTKLQCPVYV